MIQLGYVRPMDTHANPARWYRDTGVSAGGMQPAVVPFRNFGILGVLGILFLIGVFIGCVELYCETGTFAARLLYGCVATTSMLWFWYGDMNVVRAVMGWGILLLAHRSLCQFRFRGPFVLRSTATVLSANHY